MLRYTFTEISKNQQAWHIKLAQVYLESKRPELWELILYIYKKRLRN